MTILVEQSDIAKSSMRDQLHFVLMTTLSAWIPILGRQPTLGFGVWLKNDSNPGRAPRHISVTILFENKHVPAHHASDVQNRDTVVIQIVLRILHSICGVHHVSAVEPIESHCTEIVVHRPGEEPHPGIGF